MRTFFVLFAYLCATNSLPANETSRVLNGTLSNGTTSLQTLNTKAASNENLIQSSAAPVHEQLNEELMPQHMGREHIFEHAINKVTLKTILTNSSTVLNKTNEILPIKDVSMPNQNHVVPKKGVSLSPAMNLSSPTPHDKISIKSDVKSSNISANATVVHKKPLILESDSDSLIDQDSKETPISIQQIDPALLHSKPQRAEYIIPIVGVILSVPVVAILMSLIYKRGADWWRYRNYKRMDFLIEGMYQ